MVTINKIKDKIMYLTRDKLGHLVLWQNKPWYDGKRDQWRFHDDVTLTTVSIPKEINEVIDAFPEVTFENSPVEVTLSYKNDENGKD